MRIRPNADLWKSWAGAAALAMAAVSPALAADGPVTTPEGVVHVPAFDLPPSPFMSQEAVDLLKQRAVKPMVAFPSGSITQIRAAMEEQLAPTVRVTQARYPAEVIQQTMGGVPVRIITPKGKAVDPGRILINLHGGGFTMCAVACALMESLPIASVGGFKIVSVDYRQGPENKFPAATEDVVAVYRELLKTYRPKQIGIFGCSAGGALSAEVGAWLPAHGLPQAGALGVFGAGGVPFRLGDSAYVSGYIEGLFPPPAPGTKATAQTFGYFEGVDMADPMVAPALHLDVLAKFPPTLVITGSRAMDLSPAIYTHSQLVKAGAPADLLVAEGLGHCYFYNSQLPESQDAYKAITDFFRENLG